MAHRPAVWEVGLLARVTWLFHSLNNEGSVGTSVRPRRLLMPTQGGYEERDGISGEMLKHTHASFVHYLAVSESELPLCEGCRFLHPQRTAFRESPASAFAAVGRCVLCDLHGFLVPGGTVHRDSVVQFGWAVSLQAARPQSHQHARHDPFRGATRAQGEPATQMTYSRPTRSGTYALASLLQLWRIGVDILAEGGETGDTYRHLPEPIRRRRARAALVALRAMLLRAEGAMVATRLPHPTGVSGVLVVSLGPPVPMVSPLADGFEETLAALADGQLEVHPFRGATELDEAFRAAVQAVETRGVGLPRVAAGAGESAAG